MFATLSFLLLLSAMMVTIRPRESRWLQIFFLVLLSMPLCWAASTALGWMSGTPGYRYDQYLFQIDRWFGSPSWAIGSFLLHHQILLQVAKFDYMHAMEISLFAIVFCIARGRIKEAWRTYAAMVLMGALSSPFYGCCPASGPIYAFPGFPENLPFVATAHQITLSAAANCMPSVHMALAYAVLYLSLKVRRFRILAGVHTTLTFLSTLGLGEHYLIDLIAAIPYTAFVIWLCQSRIWIYIWEKAVALMGRFEVAAPCEER